MGCALAYQLAIHGVNVILIERDTLASQSTARNAGGVRQQFLNEATVRMQMLSLALFDSFEEEFGTSPGFKRIGYIFVLTRETDGQAFREGLAMWERLGIRDARWVSADDIHDLSPAVSTDDVIGGTFCPSDGIASPVDVTYAYAAAARRLGARLFEHCELRGFDRRGDCIAGVQTTQGKIDCGAVFICAGAWSRQVGQLAGVEVPVDPYRRDVYVTGPVRGVSRDTPMTVDFATGFYFHPEGEGALVGMGNAEPPTFRMDRDPTFLERLGPVVAHRAPAFLEAGVRTGWAGLYEITPDYQPILGPVSNVRGLWCGCGFSGHGFMQAPAASMLLVEQFVYGQPSIELAAFSHDRFAENRLSPESAVI